MCACVLGWGGVGGQGGGGGGGDGVVHTVSHLGYLHVHGLL